MRNRGSTGAERPQLCPCERSPAQQTNSGKPRISAVSCTCRSVSKHPYCNTSVGRAAQHTRRGMHTYTHAAHACDAVIVTQRL